RMIPFLVFFAVIALGGAVILVRRWRRRMLEDRLFGIDAELQDDNDRPFSGGGHAASSSSFINTVEQIGRAVSTGKPEAGLREWLAQAGYYDDSAPTIYVGAQLVLGLLALSVGGAVAFSFNFALVMRVCIVVAFLAAFALLPNILVTLRRRRRTGEVRRNLPDAIDLLEICVSSGMGLDMAWN